MKNAYCFHQFSLPFFFSFLASFIFYWHRPEKSYEVSNRTWGHWVNEMKISHECWANSGNQDLGVTGLKPVKRRSCWVLSSVSEEESQMGPQGQERHRWCIGFNQILVLIPLDIGLRNRHSVQTPFQTCLSCLNPSSIDQSISLYLRDNDVFRHWSPLWPPWKLH